MKTPPPSPFTASYYARVGETFAKASTLLYSGLGRDIAIEGWVIMSKGESMRLERFWHRERSFFLAFFMMFILYGSACKHQEQSD